MADVRPFRAVRYARPRAELTAPPYDVVDDDQAAALRARDPHNVAHLTLEADEARAGERYRSWLEEGVLVHDEQATVWALAQDYVGPDGVARRRDGIVASLRVEPYASGTVLPHERTHAGPRESRLRLLRAARAQLEPIFLLYDGPPPFRPPDRLPDLEAEGTKLWRVDEDVHDAFASTQLLIADGHHRYETAVAFAEEDGADRMMVVLVSTSDPGLEVFPTHRLFDEPLGAELPGDDHASAETALSALDAEPRGRAAAVRATRERARLVHGSDGELDVELVDRLGHEGISYTPDRAEALRRVGAGASGAAFLLRPTPIEEVFARARAGQVLPPKTTYFFPKLLSGLLFHPVDQ